MSEPFLTSGDLIARFQALDDFLLKHQALWRPRPFQHLHLPWESELPELAAWLRCRSLEQAEASDSELFALIAPAPFTDLARQAQALSQLGELPRLNSPERAHAFSVDVPGRKLAQIQAFASHLQFRQRPSHWLDWCSGKGHLGRWLTQDDQRLTCLEYAPSLVASGSALSARLRLNAEHLQQDVLADDCSERLQENTPRLPCMPVVIFTYACCNWPAARDARNWQWRPAATTVLPACSTKRSRPPHRHRRCSFHATTWACR